MKKISIATLADLSDRQPAHALVANVDLVIIRFDDEISVLYGRCAHRGALMSDGHVSGDNLICGVHDWDYRLDTGISEYNNSEKLHKFNHWVKGKKVWVDADEIAAWEKKIRNPSIATAIRAIIRIHIRFPRSRMQALSGIWPALA